MKEPTGNAEAELVYWQQRAIKAEASVEQLAKDVVLLQHQIVNSEALIDELRYELRDSHDY